ncbi:MAG TPA: acyl-CoA desaturase [Kofleriaceae bacterium]|nr:acyl-CoA desaturase [Kofleriaceae bacterium]
MRSTRDIRELRAELTCAGVFEPDTTYAWAKFALVLAVLAGLLWAAVTLPWWGTLVALPLAAIFAATAAMTGHEAAHGAFSSSKRENELVLHLAFPLFCGLGVLHWKNKHNVRHHGHPNVIGKDNDLNVWPMASSSVEYAGSGPFRRWIQRNFQGYLFWPLTLFLGFVMRTDSWAYNIAYVRQRGVDRAWLADVSCQIIHYTLWLVVPSILFGVVPVVLLYVGLWGIVGVLLAMIFAPAHMGMPIVTDPEDGWVQQLDGTRNLVMPRWMSWFFVGLDYQVEHHLFPRIPHRRLPRARAILRAWCERTGMPHHEIGYGAALRDVTRFMFVSWKLDPIPTVAPTTSAAA